MGCYADATPRFWVKGSFTSSAAGPEPIHFPAEDHHHRRGQPSISNIKKTLDDEANRLCMVGHTVLNVKLVAFIYKSAKTKWLFEVLAPTGKNNPPPFFFLLAASLTT